jgi:hypothetical protein
MDEPSVSARATYRPYGCWLVALQLARNCRKTALLGQTGADKCQCSRVEWAMLPSKSSGLVEARRCEHSHADLAISLARSQISDLLPPKY